MIIQKKLCANDINLLNYSPTVFLVGFRMVGVHSGLWITAAQDPQQIEKKIKNVTRLV